MDLYIITRKKDGKFFRFFDPKDKPVLTPLEDKASKFQLRLATTAMQYLGDGYEMKPVIP